MAFLFKSRSGYNAQVLHVLHEASCFHLRKAGQQNQFADASKCRKSISSCNVLLGSSLCVAYQQVRLLEVQRPLAAARCFERSKHGDEILRFWLKFSNTQMIFLINSRML